MLIKDQIRMAREAKGMEMSDLAMQVGVTKQSVYHWENGRSYPSKYKKDAVEQALGIRLDWSEGANALTNGKTAASMMEQTDVDLFLVLCKLPLRAKEAMSELARLHLQAIEQGKAAASSPAPAPLASLYIQPRPTKPVEKKHRKLRV